MHIIEMYLNLIALVREQPMLYDTNHPDYRRKILRNETWERIAFGSGFPSVLQAQEAWQKLRGNYRNNLRRRFKNQKQPSISKTKEVPWKFENEMEWLRPYMNAPFSFNSGFILDTVEDGAAVKNELDDEIVIEENLLSEAIQNDYLISNYNNTPNSLEIRPHSNNKTLEKQENISWDLIKVVDDNETDDEELQKPDENDHLIVDKESNYMSTYEDKVNVTTIHTDEERVVRKRLIQKLLKSDRQKIMSADGGDNELNHDKIFQEEHDLEVRKKKKKLKDEKIEICSLKLFFEAMYESVKKMPTVSQVRMKKSVFDLIAHAPIPGNVELV